MTMKSTFLISFYTTIASATSVESAFHTASFGSLSYGWCPQLDNPTVDHGRGVSTLKFDKNSPNLSNRFISKPKSCSRMNMMDSYQSFLFEELPLTMISSADDAIPILDPSNDAVTTLSSLTYQSPHGVDIAVFIAGLIPFAWATVEFWRRIAVGEPFGTGQDSVVIIGEDGSPASSRGRQVLGKGAFIVAYILFGVAAFSIAIALASTIMSPMDGGFIGANDQTHMSPSV